MLNRILTLALMLSVVVCCIFVFTEDPPELERTGPLLKCAQKVGQI